MEEEKERNKYSVMPQIFCSMAVSVSAVNVGTWVAYASVAIPKMMEESRNNETESTITVDLYSGSWIASLFYLGTIIGCLCGGLLNPLLGSRKILLITAPLAAITWIMIALSNAFWVLLVSRVISKGWLYLL